jgi:hypothetical protein
LKKNILNFVKYCPKDGEYYIALFILTFFLYSCQTRVVSQRKTLQANSIELYKKYTVLTNDAKEYKVEVLKQDVEKIYTKNKINYMINMDMIGRLNDSTRKIVVYGVGTAPNFVPLIDSLKSDLSIKKDSAGIGPSDQTSFYLKDIPVLHFFTGQHSDYHKPSDDVEKINIKGEEDVLNYIIQIIDHTLKYPKLTFQKTRTPDNGKVSFKVTLGVMPDYTFEGPGMRIDGVTDGKPASKAGIEKGDVVIKVDDKEVKDVMSYMKVLANYKKGDAAKVTVKRGDKELVKDVVF